MGGPQTARIQIFAPAFFRFALRIGTKFEGQWTMSPIEVAIFDLEGGGQRRCW